METLILFAMVLGFLIIGVPVGLSLGLSSILYVALFTGESCLLLRFRCLGSARYRFLSCPALCRPVVLQSV